MPDISFCRFDYAISPYYAACHFAYFFICRHYAFAIFDALLSMLMHALLMMTLCHFRCRYDMPLLSFRLLLRRLR